MSLAAAFYQDLNRKPERYITVKVIDDHAAQNGVTIMKTFRLHGYSASHGTQEPAPHEAIAGIQRSAGGNPAGDLPGGDVIPAAGPQPGKKSRTVEDQTHRGICMIPGKASRPVLILAGEDGLVSPAAATRRVTSPARHPAPGLHVFASAGHGVFRQAPAQALTLLRAILPESRREPGG